MGEVVSFIGPSGCGKSTLLRCLNRMNDTIESCSITGDIRLDGDDIYDSKIDVVPLRARVGIVFQKPNPFPKSIYDNVAYGPRIHGLAQNKAELDGIVEAYHTSNKDLAIEVQNSDVEIDKIHTELHKSIIDAMAHNPDGLVSGVHLLFIIKNFERIGDYATGIAEQVYFLSEGEFIEDFRPKADKTSWNA